MKVKAVGSTIIIRRMEAKELFNDPNSKILIPQAAELNSQFGVIVSVGPGPRDMNGLRRAMGFKEGDRVVFNRLGIVNITVGTEALCAVKEQDIFGTIED